MPQITVVIGPVLDSVRGLQGFSDLTQSSTLEELSAGAQQDSGSARKHACLVLLGGHAHPGSRAFATIGAFLAYDDPGQRFPLAEPLPALHRPA